MILALTIVACILFLICALYPPYEANWPNRFIALGLFFWSLSTIWGKL